MKKKIPKKITLDNLEKSAIKYLEKYSVSEYQLTGSLRKKIIKTSFFYKTDPQKDFKLIEKIISKFKKIGLIDDKKFSENKAINYVEKGYSKKKIIFNLKSKGISDENIQIGINSLEESYFNSEILSLFNSNIFLAPTSPEILIIFSFIDLANRTGLPC